MTRFLSATAAMLALSTPWSASRAQFRAARSAEYLFLAGESDGRVVWVNPASLGTAFEASLTVEGLLARRADSSYGLDQYGIAFSSRGFAFGFRHDRFDDSTSGNAFRVGFGRGFARLAVGASVSLYPGDPDQREVELGARYLLARSFEVGAVLRHILKPTVRGVPMPIAGTLGATWAPAGPLRLSADVSATDRVAASGYDVRSRAGLVLGPGLRRLPVALLGVVDFGDDVKPDRLVLGLQIGGLDRGVVVTDLARRGGTVFVDGVSLAAISQRPLSARR